MIYAIAHLMITIMALEPPLSCHPALGALFAPRYTQAGEYDICTSTLPLERLVAVLEKDGTKFGSVETMDVLDAFGAAGQYNRSALARLYRGTRVRVVHGWRLNGAQLDSVTLVSPYPNLALTELVWATMVIHYRIQTRGL
jgi:hypothetical protein